MYDILVLGAGISGLSAAIHAAEKGLSVVILTKGAKPDGSSNYAQGGIATVTEKTDKFKFHIDDTLEAGAGLCKKEPVNILTKSGPDTIRQLVKWGVQFTPDPTDKTQFDLHLEGGHSHHRILHAADLTGKEIMRALLAELHNHKNIHYIENCYIKDLICKGEGKEKRCVGAKIIHQKTGIVENLYAKASILSTGGAGRIWQYTVCPHDSCGDGMAIAARAGAALQDIEFMQFHPTSLYAPSLKKPFLISEAVRGFGGILKNYKGEEFMNQVHPLHSLAPRDIVARAIHSEMQRLGKPNMFIDLSGRTPKDIKSHFPNIYAKCLDAGIDITKESHITCAEAYWSTPGLGPKSRACTPAAKSPRRASMAQTASPPIPSWKASSLPSVQSTTLAKADFSRKKSRNPSPARRKRLPSPRRPTGASARRFCRT